MVFLLHVVVWMQAHEPTRAGLQSIYQQGGGIRAQLGHKSVTSIWNMHILSDALNIRPNIYSQRNDIPGTKVTLKPTL